MTVRTLVVGDVHGCLDELDELLRLAEVAPARDRLIFLGDLLDRGPDGAGVVRRVRELGAQCVVGNHDDKHLRYAGHLAGHRADPRFVVPMKPLHGAAAAHHAALTGDDLRWLGALPVELEVDGWLLVHAGYPTNRPRHEIKPSLKMRCRYVDARGAMVSLGPDHRAPEGARRWTEAWRGPESVVYGHAANNLESPRIDEPIAGVRCIGIDTGCCYGGRLTLYDLTHDRFVQVAARAAYADHVAAQDGSEGSEPRSG